jgi:nitrate reductase gamma subunit
MEESMAGIQIAAYILGAIFVIGFAAKGMKFARMPIHLRWELYPLAGETSRPWGGSYLEDNDWYKKPAEHHSFMGEMKFFGQEVLFLKEYLHRNRGLWYVAYPLHIGIFMLVGFFGLLIVGAITMAADVAVSAETANIWGKIVYYLTLVVGAAALIMGTLGCLGLLVKKLFDPEMSPYTRRVEYFNILFVLAVFVTGLLAWVVVDATFAPARDFMKAFVTFGDPGSVSSLVAAHVILLALLLAYMPHTNMLHFFAKWFTYHKVRWDDQPNFRGSELERGLKPLLEQRVTWAAPHMEPITHWADVAKADVGSSHKPRLAPEGGD